MSVLASVLQPHLAELERSLGPRVLHATLVSLLMLNIYGVRTIRRNPFVHAAKFLLLALGGGITAALLLGKPSPLVMSNITLPLYINVFFIVCYVPMLPTILTKLGPVVDPILTYYDAAVRTFSLVSTVESFYKTVSSTSHVGAWITGFVSICFGGVLCELFFSEFRRPARLKHWGIYVCGLASLSCIYSDLIIKKLGEYGVIDKIDVTQHGDRVILVFVVLLSGFFMKNIVIFVLDRPYRSRAISQTLKPSEGGSKRKNE